MPAMFCPQIASSIEVLRIFPLVCFVRTHLIQIALLALRASVGLTEASRGDCTAYSGPRGPISLPHFPGRKEGVASTGRQESDEDKHCWRHARPSPWQFAEISSCFSFHAQDAETGADLMDVREGNVK
jgi:hypothetical protein